MSEDVLGGHTLPSSLRLCESSRCQARQRGVIKSQAYRAKSECQARQCEASLRRIVRVRGVEHDDVA